MCGCKNDKKTGLPKESVVKFADGSTRAYSSEIAAQAKVRTTPGAVLLSPAGASV